MSRSAESDHHLTTCVQCRDWGHLERHDDHWPTRDYPPEQTHPETGGA